MMHASRPIALLVLAACGGSEPAAAPPPADAGSEGGRAPGVEEIAKVDNAVDGLVADSDALFVVTGAGTGRGAIARLPKGGGAPEDLATGITLGADFQIAVDASHVYWGDHASHAVERAPKAGGPKEKAVTFDANHDPSFVAIRDGALYVQSKDGSAVDKVAMGAKPERLYDGSSASPCGIRFDATTMFVCSRTEIVARPLEGTSVTPVYKRVKFDVRGFAVDDAALVVSVGVDVCNTSSVFRVAKAGGAGEPIATGCGTNSIVADAGTVFLALTPGGVVSAGVKATTYDATANRPRVAIDSQFVYFSSYDEASGQSTISRAPR